MKKILKIVGLVVLTLVILLTLVIVFVPINLSGRPGGGYTILMRILAAIELSKPLSPNYTAKSYSFDFVTGAVESEPASSLVDIKINGGDQPIKVTVPASYTISWSVDSSLLNDPAEKCEVYGRDETGAIVIKTITGPGEWKITGASFTKDRPAPKPDEVVMDYYVIDCVKGKVPDLIIDTDTVQALWLAGAAEQY